MIGILSTVPFYKYNVQNWEDVKQRIEKNIKFSTFQRMESFDSDRKEETPFYAVNVAEILNDQITEFANEVAGVRVTVKNMWVVKYGKGDYHPVHNHSGKGYSGILYLNYDKEEHQQTFYVHPMNDPVSDKTLYSAPEVDEGVLMFVPSNVLHFTKPNNSDKERVILSFDLDIQR